MTRDVLYEGQILNLVRLEHRWEVVEHAPAVCVLALRGDDVLGVTQARPAIAQETWELPAGLMDAGETPEEAAQRELAEETQLTGDLSLITQVYTSPGFTDEKIYLFEAKGLSPAYGETDDGEDVTVSWRHLPSLWNEIREGKIASSAPTVLALSFALGRMGQ